MKSIGSFSIRAAERSDLADIQRLLTAAELPVTGVSEIIDAAPGNFLVARASTGNKLIGVAGLEMCGDDALLRSVAVDSEWRGSGVGRDLVQHIFSLAGSGGTRTLYLLTLTAEHYFPRFGFEKIDRSSVPPLIAQTNEFSSTCPSSATTMRRSLVQHHRQATSS
jgi:amino-acid N-acetyltransferase